MFIHKCVDIFTCISSRTFFLVELHLIYFFHRAIIIVHFCHNCMYFTVISWLPTYFHDNFPDAKVRAQLCSHNNIFTQTCENQVSSPVLLIM